VCHQTVSLIARYLEENGIPTVTIATARDIVEHCGVSRLLFVDFPLGNPCGEPNQVDQQQQIFEMALSLLETATGPRTTVDAGLRWSGGNAWKETVFTEAQPFLAGAAKDDWLARKETYRRLRSEGKV
jgi:D-proline reductase (dithiol) PrdB